MTNTSEPIPIPYVGSHAGPRRTLTLALRGPWGSRQPVHVTVDGSTYVLSLGGPVWFEVPADRPVHVSVHQQLNQTTGHASTVLMHWAPPELEYRAPHLSAYAGELGPPGTTRSRGGCAGALLVSVLVGAVLLMLMPVFLLVLL